MYLLLALQPRNLHTASISRLRFLFYEICFSRVISQEFVLYLWLPRLPLVQTMDGHSRLQVQFGSKSCDLEGEFNQPLFRSNVRVYGALHLY